MERKLGVGTQSHTDFVRFSIVTRALRMSGFIRKNLVHYCKLLESALRFVCMEISGVRIGGVYAKCGEGVHDIQR